MEPDKINVLWVWIISINVYFLQQLLLVSDILNKPQVYELTACGTYITFIYIVTKWTHIAQCKVQHSPLKDCEVEQHEIKNKVQVSQIWTIFCKR